MRADQCAVGAFPKRFGANRCQACRYRIAVAATIAQQLTRGLEGVQAHLTERLALQKDPVLLVPAWEHILAEQLPH
jgi:hypothetical protein